MAHPTTSDLGPEQGFPSAYYQSLCPPQPKPPFTEAAELEARWGAAWGSHDEVGVLVDPEGGWHWTRREAPHPERVMEQHGGLVRALEEEGVEIVFADPVDPRFTKAIYTRDPVVSVPGGVIIGRLAPLMRRGEEASITQAVARRGVPILRTIVGTGMVEGGSLVKLSPTLAVFGTSIRCNDAGAQQLRETLHWLDMDLLVVPMSGFSIHLDGHLGMVDVDKALVDADGLPYWFIDQLHSRGIGTIWVDPAERWAINCLAVRPGRLILAEDCPRTIEKLERRAVEVIPVPYDEIHHHGGGIHCSTTELLREPA